MEGDFNIWSPDSTKASAGANGEGINCIATDVNLNVNYGECGRVASMEVCFLESRLRG